MDQELEEFKSRIDLREYAASLGYELDRRESSRASSVMRQAGDKVIIKRAGGGHFVYFSVRDDTDNGSIIDFAMRRNNLSLGQVRKELRPWVGRPATSLPFSPLAASAKNRAQVERDFAGMKVAGRHAYLEQERRIPAALLESRRFAGRVRIDGHGNAVFPHFDGDGLCGFEKKNAGFTGFASGGEKGLWESHDAADDARLVFAESALDALSYAALFPDERSRYRSLGGQVNPQQPGLIRAAIKDLADGGEVVAAMDNDDAGRKLAALVEMAVTESNRPSLTFRLHVPPADGHDWNDALRHSFPTALASFAVQPS